MGDREGWSYWKRPLTLNELLEEVENVPDLDNIPDEITIYPPDNANDENTDEDSGEEDEVQLHNLPGSQLRTCVEVELDKLVPSEGGSEDRDEGWDSEDDIPLATFFPRRLKKTKKFDFLLDADLQLKFPEWRPDNFVGNSRTPASYFKLFFDENLVKNLTRMGNLYAQQKNRRGDIIENEMLCFLGVLILSGYCSVSRRKMYWQNSDDTHNTLVARSISRDRFQHVMNNFRCVDNTNLEQNDRFAKLRPLFQSLNEKFLEYAPNEEFHSVDEAMVPYFGRHGCKQFIRGKPIRWGYKLWVGTTRLGYIINFEPYQGSATKLPEKYKDLGLGC